MFFFSSKCTKTHLHICDFKNFLGVILLTPVQRGNVRGREREGSEDGRGGEGEEEGREGRTDGYVPPDVEAW